MFLIFVVAAANALNIPAISQVVNSIIPWLPNLFVALLVFIVGVILARFVGDLVHAAVAGTGVTGANFLAMITRVAIIAFAAIIALNQIGVGSAIVQTLFTAVVGGLALGLAIAFGLGGQTIARQIVDSWYRSLSQPTNQTNPALPNGSTRASTQPTNTVPSAQQTQPPTSPER